MSAVRILLEGSNSLAALRLLSASDEKGPWRQRWHGLAYNLSINGSQLSSAPIAMSPTRQRFWELNLNESEATPGKAPRLEIHWQPDRLIFLA